MLMSELCEVYSGVSFPTKLHKDEKLDYLVIESSAVTPDNMLDISRLKPLSVAQHSMPTNRLQKRDILIRSKGLRHEAILLQQDFPVPVVATSYFLILRLKHTELCTAEQLVSYLNLFDMQDALRKLAVGATVKHITKKRLSGLPLSLPSQSRLQQIHQLQELIRKEQRLQQKLGNLALLRDRIMSKQIVGAVRD